MILHPCGLMIRYYYLLEILIEHNEHSYDDSYIEKQIGGTIVFSYIYYTL